MTFKLGEIVTLGPLKHNYNPNKYRYFLDPDTYTRPSWTKFFESKATIVSLPSGNSIYHVAIIGGEYKNTYYIPVEEDFIYKSKYRLL